MKHFYLGVLVLLALFAVACGDKDHDDQADANSGYEATDDTVGDDDDAQPCNADASWLTATAGPAEIGNDPDASTQTNCEFMQFSWQWFLAMAQPVAGSDGERAFEELNIYDSSKTNQCDDLQTGQEAFNNGLFVRVGGKTDEEPFNTVEPAEVKQAGDGDVLYDQNGNIVFYVTYYNDTECQATSSGFLPGTMELKTAWRQITADEESTYHSVQATLDITDDGQQNPKNVLLGLVGFHLVRNTETHPEFVWASFEHNTNTMPCKPDTNYQVPSSGFSFLSANCAQCLTGGGTDCDQCDYNNAEPNTGLTGTPDEICRVYPDGVDSSQVSDNNTKTLANITQLNDQLVGTNGLLTNLDSSDPMAVWKNYFMVGALWTNEGTDSTPSSNQRGSLQLANTTMETFRQDSTSTPNCFGCHGYSSSAPLNVSHIFSKLKSVSATDDTDTTAASTGAP